MGSEHPQHARHRHRKRPDRHGAPGHFPLLAGIQSARVEPSVTLSAPVFPLTATTASFIAVDQRAIRFGRRPTPVVDTRSDKAGFYPLHRKPDLLQRVRHEAARRERQHGSVHGGRLPRRHYQLADRPPGMGCLSTHFRFERVNPEVPAGDAACQLLWSRRRAE